MKSKISKLLAIGLTLSLLASLLAFGTPVSARTLAWSTEIIPSTADNVTVATTVEVVDFAVAADGSTIYAGMGGNFLFKSVNRGVSWGQIPYYTATGNTTDLVAVAPDDANMVAVADTTTRRIWITTNGGTNWGNLGIAGSATDNLTTILDMAISPALSGIHYLAVGGITSSAAAVWKYNVGAAAPSWTKISALGGFSAGLTAFALAYSPQFPSDQVLAVTTVGSSGNVDLQLFSENFDTWNTTAGFTSYPGTVITDSGITGSTTGAIALSPDYLGSDDSMRLAFIGVTLTGSTAKNGIHRMDDVLAKELKVGASVDINSVAYDGATLVAGELTSNTTYYCSDATVSTPTVSTTRALKRPGNDTTSRNVLLAWAGADVVAGVSTKGAFSVSQNNGKSYNDISLVENLLTDLTDFVVTPDGSKAYLLTDDSTDVSLWRKASAWQRVFTAANTNDFIVRMAPDDADVVYLAQKGGQALYYTADAGEERWQIRACNVSIEDLAVEGDGTVIYALTTGGRVAKSTNAGFTWAADVATRLTSGNMIASIGAGKVLVGDNGGFVSYSTDSNATWTKILKQVGDTAAEVVLTATDLAQDGLIYAALESFNTGIYRFKIGTSETTGWDAIKSSTASDRKAYGIGLQGGALYVSTANATPAGSTVYRTLSPSIPKDLISWSTMTSTAAFNTEPQGLRISSGSAKLWAISSSDALYSYGDTLLGTAVTTTGPATEFALKMNPITGYPNDIMFTWTKPSDEALTYDLRIALDSAFDQTIWGMSPANDTTSPAPVIAQNVVGSTFTPGLTYYWRVRVAGDGPVYSSWSEVRSFTVEKAEVTPPVVISPTPLPPITITPPDVIVNVPPTVTVPPATPITPAWIYIIIVIGALLLIAVIILIVRTRRAV